MKTLTHVVLATVPSAELHSVLKNRTLGSLSFVIAAVLMGLCLGEAQAQTAKWKANTFGNWNDVENWSTDWTADPVVNALPVAPPGAFSFDGTGSSQITITSNVNVGSSFVSSAGNNTVVLDATAAPTFTVPVSLYLSNTKGSTVPNWIVDGGSFTSGNVLLAWNNTGSVQGWFVQNGGTVTMTSQLQMALKSSTQRALYDLNGGIFSVPALRVGAGSQRYDAVFNQTGGAATVSSYIALGVGMTNATNPSAQAIYKLHGGELTITSSSEQLRFTQTLGVPVYFDFGGSGTLNLRGTWDFTSLTTIMNSDFRVAGVAAQSSDLSFTPITIGDNGYTKIQIVPEPGAMALLASAAFAGCIAGRRRLR